MWSKREFLVTFSLKFIIDENWERIFSNWFLHILATCFPVRLAKILKIKNRKATFSFLYRSEGLLFITQTKNYILISFKFWSIKGTRNDWNDDNWLKIDRRFESLYNKRLYIYKYIYLFNCKKQIKCLNIWRKK